jgi:hypothetical protein
MKTVKSIEMKNFSLVLTEANGWYFIRLDGAPIHCSKHLDNCLSRFDMEYNNYCVNHQ